MSHVCRLLWLLWASASAVDGGTALWPPSLSQPETDGSCLPQGGDDDQYCESNVDEQLLLNIGFREKVKIKVPPDPKSAHQRG